MVKSLSASAIDFRDVDLITGLGRSPGGAHNNQLHDSCQENPMDRGTWWAMVHRVAKFNSVQFSSVQFSSVQSLSPV